jgi:hypothetical protein
MSVICVVRLYLGLFFTCDEGQIRQFPVYRIACTYVLLTGSGGEDGVLGAMPVSKLAVVGFCQTFSCVGKGCICAS